MKHILPLILIFSASTACAEHHTKDDWPEGSAMHTAYVMQEKDQALATQLDDSFETLTNLMTDKGFAPIVVSSFENQQAAWMDYHVAECETHGQLTGAGGAWPTTWGLSCQVEQKRERLEAVDTARTCLEETGNQAYITGEQAECLQPLMLFDYSMN